MAEKLKFSEDHLWVRVDDARVQVGLSDYGQADLGEVIAIEIPDIGDEIERGEAFGEVESTRTVVELVAPVSGIVTAINSELEEHPILLNEDPLREGWLVEIELNDEAELEDLMEPEEYEEFAAQDDAE
jgi:glycine cleavage system H protein